MELSKFIRKEIMIITFKEAASQFFSKSITLTFIGGTSPSSIPATLLNKAESWDDTLHRTILMKNSVGSLDTSGKSQSIGVSRSDCLQDVTYVSYIFKGSFPEWRNSFIKSSRISEGMGTLLDVR